MSNSDVTFKPKGFFGRVGEYARKYRPDISQRSASEMRKAKISDLVIAQGLFGAEWLPTDYNETKAKENVNAYIRTGKIVRHRWIDMELSEIPSELKKAAGRIFGARGMLTATANDRKRAVLVAWLGGIKKTKLGWDIKKSVLNAIEQKGMTQRVYVDFMKNRGTWRVGGGKEFWQVLKIGNTVRLVDAGSNIESVVKKAVNVFELGDKQKRELAMKQMNLEATRKSMQSYAESTEAHRKNRDAARQMYKLEGRMEEQTKMLEQIHNLSQGKNITPTKYYAFMAAKKGEMDKYIKNLEQTKGSDPKAITELKSKVAQFFVTATEQQNTVNDMQRYVQRTLQLSGAVIPRDWEGTITKAVYDEMSEAQLKSMYEQVAIQKAKMIFHTIKDPVKLKRDLDDLKEKVRHPITIVRSDGTSVQISLDDFNPERYKSGESFPSFLGSVLAGGVKLAINGVSKLKDMFSEQSGPLMIK